ncbi:MAG: DUF1801 domain-containing protein [Chryseolinea sp.]
MDDLDHFYLSKEEPVKSCLLALRVIILKQDIAVSAAWKYGMPFFCYHGKMFCYLWVHKKHKQPYIGIVEGKRLDHPKLIIEKRSRMKIFLVDPAADIPITVVRGILKQALQLYKSGTIPIR